MFGVVPLGNPMTLQTHIAPATDDIEQIILAERQVEDAFIYSFRGALRREVFFGNLHPAERSHCESDGFVGLRLQRITASSEKLSPVSGIEFSKQFCCHSLVFQILPLLVLLVKVEILTGRASGDSRVSSASQMAV